MQTKDIPDEPILHYLDKHQGEWSMAWDVKANTFPDIPEKLFKSKMASMIRRKLSGGCECGCRGDFVITDKGLEIIGAKRTHPYNGY